MPSACPPHRQGRRDRLVRRREAGRRPDLAQAAPPLGAPARSSPLSRGVDLPAAAARAVLRNIVTTAAEQARDEAGFFARLREAGVLVRLRFSQTCPGQVTGYAVGLPGH